ncbi:hypothetical protein M422DRAFT_39937 [Sphaerobolus stellatus SS14]|nr:hypothetical protein M422DRAFT_39937 [Sphaerobolus stellatus SS14]
MDLIDGNDRKVRGLCDAVHRYINIRSDNGHADRSAEATTEICYVELPADMRARTFAHAYRSVKRLDAAIAILYSETANELHRRQRPTKRWKIAAR